MYEGSVALAQPRAEGGSATLMGHTFANGYTLDYLAVFWIGMAALSVVCALLAGSRRKQDA